MRLDATKIRIALAERVISIKELSKISKVSYNTICAILAGKSCSIVTAGKIADGLGMPVTELLEQ